jgi:hypothetical protein
MFMFADAFTHANSYGDSNPKAAADSETQANAAVSAHSGSSPIEGKSGERASQLSAVPSSNSPEPLSGNPPPNAL